MHFRNLCNSSHVQTIAQQEYLPNALPLQSFFQSSFAVYHKNSAEQQVCFNVTFHFHVLQKLYCRISALYNLRNYQPVFFTSLIYNSVLVQETKLLCVTSPIEMLQLASILSCSYFEPYIAFGSQQTFSATTNVSSESLKEPQNFFYETCAVYFDFVSERLHIFRYQIHT